jgi:hypothetical protein
LSLGTAPLGGWPRAVPTQQGVATVQRALERRLAGAGAVVSQTLNVYLRAISVELKAREQEELVVRLEALEEALESRKGSSRWGA